YRLEFLTPAPPVLPRPSRSHKRPSYLLDPASQVVPYRHRVRAEERLRRWLGDPEEDMSILLVHGEGGQGKTRLANHIASPAPRNGWAVTQAVQKSPHTPPGQAAKATSDGGPLLVVIDYADRWPLDLLGQPFDELRLAHPNRRIRVLLLARTQAGFWRDASAVLGRHDVDLADPESLGRFTTTGAELQQAYADAATAFAGWLGIAAHPKE